MYLISSRNGIRNKTKGVFCFECQGCSATKLFSQTIPYITSCKCSTWPDSILCLGHILTCKYAVRGWDLTRSETVQQACPLSLSSEAEQTLLRTPCGNFHTSPWICNMTFPSNVYCSVILLYTKCWSSDMTGKKLVLVFAFARSLH